MMCQYMPVYGGFDDPAHFLQHPLRPSHVLCAVIGHRDMPLLFLMNTYLPGMEPLALEM